MNASIATGSRRLVKRGATVSSSGYSLLSLEKRVGLDAHKEEEEIDQCTSSIYTNSSSPDTMISFEYENQDNNGDRHDRNGPISSASLSDEKTLLNSRPSSSSTSSSAEEDDRSIHSFSTGLTTNASPAYDHPTSARSLIVTAKEGGAGLKTVSSTPFSEIKLESGWRRRQQDRPRSLYSEILTTSNKQNEKTTRNALESKVANTHSAFQRRHKRRQCDYLTLSCSNSLGDSTKRTDVSFATSKPNHYHHRPSTQERSGSSWVMRLSKSSPSGFRSDNKECSPGDVVESPLSLSSLIVTEGTKRVSAENATASPLLSSCEQDEKRPVLFQRDPVRECEEEASEGWRLLDETRRRGSPSSVRPSPSKLKSQAYSVDLDGVTGPERLPLFPLGPSNQTKSESALQTGDCYPMADAAAARSLSTVTALTPPDGANLTVDRNCPASWASNRNSVRFGMRSRDSSGIPRRHSGAASIRNIAVADSQITQTHKLSQPPPQKTSACSLMMVSPTAVSRSPSQQWLRNSIGNCVAPMPISPASTGALVTQPVQQHQPDSLSVGMVVDHRNAASGSAASGGLQNPLYNVSNEFMRVAGYTQQFKRLLSKRNSSVKESTHEPPAVVTFATDAKEKDIEKGHLTIHVPVVTGSGIGHDLNEQAALAAVAIAAGGAALVASPGNGAAGLPCISKDGPMDPNGDIRVLDPRRQSRKSAYGRLWKEQPNFKHRLKKRKHLFVRRTKISDFALLFAISGIILTILEAELTASAVVSKASFVSLLLRSLIVVTTMVLIALVICYHAIETKVSVIDSGAEDWRVAITNDRIWQCALEVAICSVCPFPVNVNVTWDRLKADHRTPYPVLVPLDAVLSVPMFLRFYLFGRFMALHSRQFQDAATRSIAALNHIAVNFTFVLKTLMYEHPLRVLILFTVAFWVAMSWILTQCERYVSSQPDLEQGENNHYLNSIWFIIITFMSIGYGDIVPNTYCGRALAITTGIVGAGVSSALIAVISRKLELSRAEKHVNQFMTDSKLTRQRKEAAAAVLQHTWFIHKYKNIPKAKDDMKLRMHQRRFLAAINEFRRVKWDQRKLAEQGNALVDVAKLQSEMHETLWDMQQNQDHLVTQMNVLMQKVQELQEIILAHNISQQIQAHQQYQAPRKIGTPGVITTEMSLHPVSPPGGNAPQFKAPVVIAQHVESSQDLTPNASFDEDVERTVML